MRVTFHAAERFLQRVFRFSSYTAKEVKRAIRLLERDLRGIDPRGRNRLVLPSFPQFYGVLKNGAVVTVIPK